jgi:hypothetical protein
MTIPGVKSAISLGKFRRKFLVAKRRENACALARKSGRDQNVAVTESE